MLRSFKARITWKQEQKFFEIILDYDKINEIKPLSMQFNKAGKSDWSEVDRER